MSDLQALAGNLLPTHTHQDQERGCALCHPAIVFIQGHQSPQCLIGLGDMFEINPLFFQRHVDCFLPGSRLKLFDTPVLPSHTLNIIRLRIATIGRGEAVWGSTSKVDSLRTEKQSQMEKYVQQLRVRGKSLVPGNSMVRSFNVHSSQYFSIEQEITMTVQRKQGTWVVLVWTDLGDSLALGPKGPWHAEAFPPGGALSPPERTFFPPENTFLPHIRHFPCNVTLLTSTSTSMTDADVPEPGPHPLTSTFAQSGLLLAKGYGESLDPALMEASSFYAMSELFQYSASTVCQLLNVINDIIDECMGYKLSKSPNRNLANLAYHLDILNRLENGLRENLFDLKHHESADWPRNNDANAQSSINEKLELVALDFEKLISRVESISARCRSGMSICMSSASIEESQRAIKQARQIELLTWFAFLYIPLSFMTSFFGMNVNFLDPKKVSIGIWVSISIPLVVVSYTVLILVRMEKVRAFFKRWFELVGKWFE